MASAADTPARPVDTEVEGSTSDLFADPTRADLKSAAFSQMARCPASGHTRTRERMYDVKRRTLATWATRSARTGEYSVARLQWHRQRAVRPAPSPPEPGEGAG